MKKVILIEDRFNRQRDFIKNLDFDLNTNSTLKNICGGEDFVYYKNMIDNSNFTVFNQFDVIIAHRSALSNLERLKLTEYVKSKSKILVFFSGGISSISLQNLNSGYLLTINSKDLYSIALIEYLNNGGNNILELAFGKKWQINLEVMLLDKLNLYLNDYAPKPIQIILSDLKITDWVNDIYFRNLNGANTVISKQQLEEVKESVLTSLSKKI